MGRAAGARVTRAGHLQAINTQLGPVRAPNCHLINHWRPEVKTDQQVSRAAGRPGGRAGRRAQLGRAVELGAQMAPGRAH